MVTYYVRKTGSSSAAGTSAGAAWNTIQKALSGTTGSSSAGSSTTLTTSGLTASAWIGARVTILTGTGTGSVGTVTANTTTEFTVSSWSSTAPSGAGTFAVTHLANGDELYIGAGRYDEAVTATMTSATAEVVIIGDVTGEFTGDTGEVAWTGFTSGLDAAGGATPLILSARDFLTFQNICFYGGLLGVDASSSSSTNIAFTDCAFHTGGSRTGHRINILVAADSNASWTFDRCDWFGWGSTALNVTFVTGAGAEYDANILLRNCTILNFSSNGGAAINLTNSGTTSGKGGGVDIHNCTIMTSGGSAISTVATHFSTTIPCAVYNSFICAGGFTGLSAGTAGQIVEEDNFIVAGTRDALVTDGVNTLYESRFVPIHMGQEHIYGGVSRRPGTPAIVGGGISRLLGRGSNAAVTLTVDKDNKPRPSGGASALKGWGALERHDTAVQETSVTDAGTSSIKITGPGNQTIYVAVPASATTISVKTRFDTNHGTTNRPRAVLLANGKIGVATTTATAIGAIDTWETLTIGPFTPTAVGVVAIRLEARAAAAAGIAYFDTVSIT